MICPECGAKFEAKSGVCPNCGAQGKAELSGHMVTGDFMSVFVMVLLLACALYGMWFLVSHLAPVMTK